LKVHRSHRLDLDLPGGTAAQLEAYLSDPSRALQALLNRKKIQQGDGGRFYYISRPYSLLMFRIQPEVVFRANWTDSSLQIEFEDCTIRGLGNLDSLVVFCCHAKIFPGDMGLVAEAVLSLEMKSETTTVWIPRGVLQAMGEKALQLIIERLEKRCRTGLLRGVKGWIVERA
jgi:hypothetical protein